jgi:uncharacterized protein
MRERLLRLFLRLARERTHLVLGCSLALAASAGILAATRLRIDSDQDHLISEELPYHRRYLDFLEEFGDLEYLYAVIDGRRDIAQARDFADALAAELRAQPEHFTRVHVRLTSADLGQNLLLLAPESELRQLESLRDQPQTLRGITASRDLAELFDALSSSFEESPSDTSPGAQERGWHFLQGLVAAVDSASASGGTAPPEHEVAALADLLLPALEVPREASYDEHGGLVLVSFMPLKDYGSLDPIRAELDRARALVASVQERFPEVEAGITGRPALGADEVQRSSQDMTLASILAVACVSLVFMIFFRGVVRPLVTVLALLVGVAWSAGFATIAVGQLNLVSSVFGVVLVGIGIDFGIHLLARYQQALATLGDVDGALEDALLHAGRGNLTAAFTTAAAFFTALLTDFEGLAQLGVIAGSGVLLCALSMLLVLPAALYALDRGSPPEGLRPLHAFAGLERLSSRPRWTLCAVLILCAVSALGARRVRFEEDLLELQSQAEESVRWERVLLATDTSTWLTASLVDSVPAAIERHAELAALEPVARVESVASFLGPEAERTRARVRAIGTSLGPLGRPALRLQAGGPRLAEALERFGAGLEDLAEVTISNGLAEETEAILALAERVLELAERVPPASPALDQLQAGLLNRVGARAQRLTQLLDPPGWTLENLPSWIRGRLVGKSGQLAVYVFPRESVWDPAAMTRFLGAIKAVDPKVTGATVSVSESGKVLRSAFATMTALTALVILLLVLIEHRHWRGLIALVPLGVGGLWFLGAMGALGVSFNMANFFIVSVLIGLGVDDGVHMLNRSLEDPQGSLVAHATGTGIILSSLTTIVGFGALMISSHVGVASMGQVMALGAGMLLLSALVAQPALSRLLLSGASETPSEDEEPSADSAAGGPTEDAH